MDAMREKMLREVMAADFTVYDLSLYLDTHPCDTRCLALRKSAVQRAEMLTKNYERLYGPLTSHASNSNYVWQWIEGPWPWEEG